MKKYIKIFVLLFVVSATKLIPQTEIAKENYQAFFFDAICFKNSDTLEFFEDGRVDVLLLIPYQSLRFEKSNEFFTASYEMFVEIFDTSGQKLVNEKIPKSIKETDYNVTQGGTAGFDILSRNYFLNAGNYEVRISLIDLLSGKTASKSRTITIVNFHKYNLALSGIMLLSSIEEKAGRYKITPHISDNIGMLSDGFFIFFETYNNKNYDSMDYVYEVYDKKDNLITKSEIFSSDVSQIVNRTYKKIKLPANLKQGVYKIRLIALKSSNNTDYTEKDYLAITERSIKFHRSFAGVLLEDIDKSIRYLRYIASSAEIDYIESAENDLEKQKRFEEFWKKIDPSPNTEKNEAFEDYFARIQYANKNFKSYTEGWLTDMGMVYIIFGPPDYTDKSDTYSSRTVYIKWTYLNNREFVFADDKGFGDFRLIRPYSVTEKYRYGN